jgi:hypothetical protein
MRHVPSIATKFVSIRSVSSPRRSKKSIFAIILYALHHSRRLQAERTLRRYRDLIDRAEHSIAAELKLRSGEHSMFRNERLLHREPTVQVPAFTRKTLIVTTLIVFLLLHLFAAAVLQRASARDDRSPQQDKTFQLYD